MLNFGPSLEEYIDCQNEAKKQYQFSYGKKLEMYIRNSEKRSTSHGAWKVARSLSAQISVIGPLESFKFLHYSTNYMLFLSFSSICEILTGEQVGNFSLPLLLSPGLLLSCREFSICFVN